MSEDVVEAEAPAEEQAATDDMCLGGSWVLQKDKCQVSDNACRCLKHVETMTALAANGCDP